MPPVRRLVVLVTGASTGLGLAIARAFLERGRHHLVLTARAGSLPRFTAAGLLEAEHLWIRALDVTDAGQRATVVAEIERELGGVDILVNNAGVAFRAVVEHVRDDDRLAQLDVNFRAPMELARLVLPGMRARRRGHIVNVSSVGGMMAMPTMAVYAASKFALGGASEALWYEVRPFGVHVTLIQPGFVRSESFLATRSTSLSSCAQEQAGDPYHAHYAGMSGFIARLMARALVGPAHVARVVVRATERRRPPLRVAATPDAVFFFWLRRLLPRTFYHWLLYRSLPGVGGWGLPLSTRAHDCAEPAGRNKRDAPPYS